MLQSTGLLDLTNSEGAVELWRVKVENVRAGSVKADFEITPKADASPASLTQLVEQVAADPGNSRSATLG